VLRVARNKSSFFPPFNFCVAEPGTRSADWAGWASGKRPAPQCRSSCLLMMEPVRAARPPTVTRYGTVTMHLGVLYDTRTASDLGPRMFQVGHGGVNRESRYADRGLTCTVSFRVFLYVRVRVLYCPPSHLSIETRLNPSYSDLGTKRMG
jgi:hypothetical protein